MKLIHILSLSALSTLTTAFPYPLPSLTPQKDTSPSPQTIAFATFKVPSCALNTTSHIESHDSTPNGHCISLIWSRSIAYNAAFTHTSCDAKFYADDKCSPEKEVGVGVAPRWNAGEVVDGYYPGCWDDVGGLNTWGGVYQDGLVPSVNLTVTCR